LEIQPKYSYRYACRGYALNFFGDIDAALLDYEKAVELDPDDAVAHNNLGLLLEQKGYKEQAKKRFERADKLSKQEDQLFSVMDDIEQGKVEEETQTAVEVPEEKPEREMVSPEVKREAQISAMQEFKKVFTSKEQFKEFMRFIKNGFRIK